MIRAALLALLAAAAPARAAFQAGPVVGQYDYSPSTDARGVAAAFYPNGDALFLGLTQAGPSFGMVARVTPGMGQVFEAQGGVSGCLVHSVAILPDETAVVVGRDATSYGFLFGINANGSAVGQLSVFGAQEFWDAAVDPVDGTIWAVGLTSGAPTSAVLAHFSHGSSSFTQIGSAKTYQEAFNSTEAYGVAVTPDRIWVAGRTNPSGNWIPWLASFSRGDLSLLSHGTQNNVNAVYWKVRARGGLVATLHVQENAALLSARLMTHAPADGSLLAQAVVYSGIGGMLSPISDLPGGLALHPTLPILAAASTTKVMGFDAALASLWQSPAVGASDNPVIHGVALSDGLSFRSAASFAHAVFPPPYKFSGVVERIEPTLEKAGAINLVVAPNRLDWSAPSPALTFLMRKGTAGGSTILRIYDAAGRFLLTFTVPLDASGIGQLRWDGKLEDGSRLAPGAYLAACDGGGLTSADRRTFLVTSPVKK